SIFGGLHFSEFASRLGPIKLESPFVREPLSRSCGGVERFLVFAFVVKRIHNQLVGAGIIFAQHLLHPVENRVHLVAVAGHLLSERNPLQQQRRSLLVLLAIVYCAVWIEHRTQRFFICRNRLFEFLHFFIGFSERVQKRQAVGDVLALQRVLEHVNG